VHDAIGDLASLAWGQVQKEPVTVKRLLILVMGDTLIGELIGDL